MKDEMKRIVAVVAVALAACSGAKKKPADEKVPVMVAVVQSKDVPIQIRAIGSVQPISNVAVRALVGGQLEKISFREGDDVRRGETLFTIDPRPYQAALAQAQANLARDEANLRNAESQAARYADLVKKDFVTREDFDKFTSAAAAARATVAADRAAVDNARLQLSYCEIRSPLDGRTGSLMVHAGNIVKANDTTPMVVINQITPMYVQFAVPEGQLGDFRSRGLQDVPVTAAPQAGGAEVTNGKLTFVDNAVDTSTGTITLKATFPNADRRLWPGQFVNVAVTLASEHNATVVPSQAVQTGQKGQYIYVVKGSGGVEMRPIKVTSSNDEETIIASGVKPGETVVTDGQLRLTPVSKVQVKNKV